MFEASAERLIAASPDAVAAVFLDPRRDPEWMGGAKRAIPLDDTPYGVGARLRREGGFLGRTIAWTTVTEAYEPGRRAVMRIEDGPFEGEVEYTIEPGPEGEGAKVRIVNRGRMGGAPDWFSRWVVAQSTKADLARLARLLEVAS